jgi:hypothetical protein
MLVSYDTKIRYKGREYSRLEEIPPDIRRPLERALQRLNGTGTSHISAHLNSRIVLNGRAVTSPTQLPPAERKMVEEALQPLFPIETAVCLAAATERKNFIYGIVGLTTIFVGLAAYVVRLWLHGYFA